MYLGIEHKTKTETTAMVAEIIESNRWICLRSTGVTFIGVSKGDVPDLVEIEVGSSCSFFRLGGFLWNFKIYF